MLPSTLLALTALLSALLGRRGSGDRRRRRRRSSPSPASFSSSSRLRVAAVRSSLLCALSGVSMIIFFACFVREGKRGERDRRRALPPHVLASGCALTAAGLSLAVVGRRRSSLPLPLIDALSFASATATLVAAGSSWVAFCLFFLAAEREEAEGPPVERRHGSDKSDAFVLLVARACFLSLASASLWAGSICSRFARRREGEEGEDASNDGAQQREPLLASESESEESEETPPPPPPKRRPRTSSSWSMGWVSPLLSVGSLRQLTEADLFSVPERDAPQEAASALAQEWRRECRRSSSSAAAPSLSRCVWRVYGMRWLSLGFLKLLSDSLNFAGPMLLNALVGFVTPKGGGDGQGDEGESESGTGISSPSSSPFFFHFPRRGSPAFGFAAAFLLALAAVSKAFLNSRYSFGMASLSAALRSSLGSAVHGAALAGGGGGGGGGKRPTTSGEEREENASSSSSSFSDGDVATLASVDVDRAANGLGAAVSRERF